MEPRLHDRAGYRYALLSALALAGELTFDDAPDNVPESEFQFTQHWEDWARANKDYLKQNDKLFERSVHFEDILQGDCDCAAQQCSVNCSLCPSASSVANRPSGRAPC